MKKVFGILAITLPLTTCVTSIIVIPNALPESALAELGYTIKVMAWLLFALLVVAIVVILIGGVVMAIGWALGQSKSDVKEIMGAAIALVRGSTSLNRVLRQRRNPVYLPPPAAMHPYEYEYNQPEEEPEVQTYRVHSTEPWQDVR